MTGEGSSQAPRLFTQVRALFLPERGGRLSEHFRAKRWEKLSRRFPELPDMSVIDLGGYARNWANGPAHPKALVVVNMDAPSSPDQPDWVTTLRADACQLPAELFERRADLVYSNSLIEHVGGYWRRAALAEAVHRLGDHHWVQTPARYFPLEPHWLFPCFQFLPVRARAEIARFWPMSPPECRNQTLGDNISSVLQVELVSTAEMRRLFPSSEIYRERVAGITKSVTAIL